MLSRRQILRMTGGVAAASLAGCTDQGNQGDNQETETSQQSTSQNQAPTTLSVTQYTNDRLPDWQPLYDATDIKELSFTPVSGSFGTFVSKVLQGSAGDEFAIIGNNATIENAFCGSVQEIDTSRIDNWDQLPDYVFEGRGLNQWNDPTKCGADEDRLVSVPGAGNADSFAYDENTTGELNSYEALFDDEWNGMTAIQDNWSEPVHKTALYLKHNNMADIDSPADMVPSEIETVIDFLIEQKNQGQFRTLWSSFEEGINLLTSGEVVVLEGWQAQAGLARERGLEGATYATTDEGYLKFTHGWMIPNGAEANRPGMKDLIYQFFNFLHSGYYSAKIADISGFAMPNMEGALEYVEKNPDEFDNPDSVRETYETTHEKWQHSGGAWANFLPKHKDTYVEEWNRFKRA
jgi:putative spermidine/putrescine transport system substrate-binding protein